MRHAAICHCRHGDGWHKDKGEGACTSLQGVSKGAGWCRCRGFLFARPSAAERRRMSREKAKLVEQGRAIDA